MRRFPNLTLAQIDELDIERYEAAWLAEYVLDLMEKRKKSMQPGGLSSVELTPEEMDLITEINELEVELQEQSAGNERTEN